MNHIFNILRGDDLVAYSCLSSIIGWLLSWGSDTTGLVESGSVDNLNRDEGKHKLAMCTGGSPNTSRGTGILLLEPDSSITP